jgi:hypothetical protein
MSREPFRYVALVGLAASGGSRALQGWPQKVSGFGEPASFGRRVTCLLLRTRRTRPR